MSRKLKIIARNTANLVIGSITVIVSLILVLTFILAQNNWVITNKIVFQNNKIPKSFVGYNIVHISDICNRPLNTLTNVRLADPDLVIITGNFADSNGNYEKALKLVNDLTDDYRVMFTLGEYDNDTVASAIASTGAESIGNTYIEIASPQVSYDEFVEEYIGDKVVKDANSGDVEAVKYLEYTKSELENSKDSRIIVSGINTFPNDTNADLIGYIYDYISLEKDAFQILAFSQSQYIDNVANVDIDLGITGNTFGEDRFSNQYVYGLYSVNGKSIIVSNGIGNSPNNKKRVLNFPSINLITLSDGTIVDKTPIEKLLDYFINDVGTKFDSDSGFQEYKYEY